jgi:tRNA dimethylallyltransferase
MKKLLDTHIITIGGQTSSGKSEMAVQLARKLGDCWIVNMDSRQIYKKLDLGTGKVPGTWKSFEYKGATRDAFFYADIPHFLIDIADPTKPLTLVDVLEMFVDLCKNPLPKYLILTGGTGLYIKAIVEGYDLTQLRKPDEIIHVDILKTHLRTQSTTQLQEIFESYSTPPLNNSEYNNPQRLVNNILNLEIKKLGFGNILKIPKFDSYQQFAIRVDQNNLRKNIETRIIDRIDQGMLEEIDSLSYLGEKRLFDLGLEYRYGSQFLQGKINKQEFEDTLIRETINYAKRQMTWLKAQHITWIYSVKEIFDPI